MKVVAHEREDFVKGEDVQLAPDGRPVANITTEREDGYDNVVFVPAARSNVRDKL